LGGVGEKKGESQYVWKWLTSHLGAEGKKVKGGGMEGGRCHTWEGLKFVCSRNKMGRRVDKEWKGGRC